MYGMLTLLVLFQAQGFFHYVLLKNFLFLNIVLLNTNNFKTNLRDLQMGPHQEQPLRGRMDLVVMPMKDYSTLSRSPELEPHHQMLFNFLLKTSLLEGSYPSAENKVSVF